MAPAGLSFPCQVLRLPAREQQSSLWTLRASWSCWLNSPRPTAHPAPRTLMARPTPALNQEEWSPPSRLCWGNPPLAECQLVLASVLGSAGQAWVAGSLVLRGAARSSPAVPILPYPPTRPLSSPAASRPDPAALATSTGPSFESLLEMTVEGCFSVMYFFQE